jgi:2-polyprenyl-3-methyl-5-hydroxy-6-metoxy-1,4-benzoquinol methylase
MDEIQPIAMPGTHQKFLAYLEKKKLDKSYKILDIGAGHGAFSKKLYESGYDVSACDLFPENFHYDKIECKKADITSDMPYRDESFDAIMAIEVSEHIIDHEVFFKEAARILKPTGKLYLSTPNILSLKSRLRFLFSGFFYSFGPLEKNNYNGLQHVNSRTPDQYNYIAIKYGFKEARFEIDRVQSSSRWILILLFPLWWTVGKIKRYPSVHNDFRLILGRILFLEFEKK